MKKTAAAMVLAGLVMWLGYCLGYHRGVQRERQAWLATEQFLRDPAPAVVAGRSHALTTRSAQTIYRYPHSGETVWTTSELAPVNMPDQRNLPTR